MDRLLLPVHRHLFNKDDSKLVKPAQVDPTHINYMNVHVDFFSKSDLMPHIKYHKDTSYVLMQAMNKNN